MIADEPDDELSLSPEQIAAELRGAGIGLTKLDLQAMIKAVHAEAKVEPRAVELYALKVLKPDHLSYETVRRAAASGDLRAHKFGTDDDWFVAKADLKEWIRAKPRRWFKSEGAAAEWLAYIAQLKPKWIV
jgi:phosphoribosylformylglycinamidine (FGAM) synthase-like enzyme